MIKKCIGCGIPLQTKYKHIEGYVEDINKEICERCFKLKYYGEYKEVTLDNKDYQNILNSNQIIVEENKDIDKFKYLSVNVKIKAPYILVKNVKISTSGLEEYLENNNITILSTGGVDAYMEKTEKVLVYLNNVDEKSLKNILKDFKYVLQWSNIWNKIDKVNCYFNDYLK